MSILSINRNASQHKNISPPTRNCICCLAENFSYVLLDKCKHKQILVELFKYKIDFNNSVICSFCHRFLQKIEEFIKIIQNSIKSSIGSIKSDTKSSLWLNISKVHIVSVTPKYSEDSVSTNLSKKVTFKDPLCQATEINDTIESLQRSEDVARVYLEESLAETRVFGSNVKTEPESEDEVDGESNEKVEAYLEKRSDTSETESEKELTDFIKTPESFEAPTNATLYSGRIKIVTLTSEQVLAERETLSKHPGYADKDFKCEFCIKGFIRKRALESHMRKHDEKQGLSLCPICNTYQKNEVIFKSHYKRHFIRYECVICGLRFMAERSCGGHYNSSHGEQHGVLAFGFRCKLCDYVTDCYRTLTRHKVKHKKVSLECKECFKTFTSASGYASHVRNLHSEEKPLFKCKSCGKVYQSPSSLRCHMESKHLVGGAKARTYCCADCKTVYRNRQGLVAHLKTHSRHATKVEATLVCHDCGGKFRNKPEIQRHIYLNHMPINKCHVCSKAFSSSRTLRTHVECVHLGREAPRDKICQYCGKGFTTNMILETHIRTHTLERPLKCPHCPATFAHSAARYNHKRLVHNPNRVRKRQSNKKQGVDNKL